MDNNGNHMLDVDDFRWGLRDYGIVISKEESQQVLQYFDRDGNGQVDFNEFLRALKVRGASTDCAGRFKQRKNSSHQNGLLKVRCK